MNDLNIKDTVGLKSDFVWNNKFRSKTNETATLKIIAVPKFVKTKTHFRKIVHQTAACNTDFVVSDLER